MKKTILIAITLTALALAGVAYARYSEIWYDGLFGISCYKLTHEDTLRGVNPYTTAEQENYMIWREVPHEHEVYRCENKEMWGWVIPNAMKSYWYKNH